MKKIWIIFFHFIRFFIHRTKYIENKNSNFEEKKELHNLKLQKKNYHIVSWILS